MNIIKSEAEIREMIKEIESDERIHYKPANVMVNAPLALHQISQKAKLAMLEWILAD